MTRMNTALWGRISSYMSVAETVARSFAHVIWEGSVLQVQAALQFHVVYKRKVKPVTWPNNPGDCAEWQGVKVGHMVLQGQDF